MRKNLSGMILAILLISVFNIQPVASIEFGTLDIGTLDISVSDSPDPFNPSLGETNTISINNVGSVPCKITLFIEDTGREWLWEQVDPPNSVQALWDGKDSEGNIVSAGTYTYTATAVLWNVDLGDIEPMGWEDIETGTITVLGGQPPEVGIEIIQPKSGDISWIEAEPEPKMPTITCQAKVVGITPDPTATIEFSWEAMLRYEYKETVFWPPPTHVEDRVFEESFYGKNIKGGSWTPEFRNTIAGGKLQIKVTARINGEEYQDDATVFIKAHNPSDTLVKNRLGKLMYQVISYKESSPKWHQFYPQGHLKEGLPICSSDYGYGLMQITARPSIGDIWSWSQNIATGKLRWDNEYDRAKEYEEYEIQEKIKVGKPPYEKFSRLSKEQLEEAACYHYNSGYKYRYWILDKVAGEWAWKVNPNAIPKGILYAKDAMNIKAQVEAYIKAREEGQPLPPLPLEWGEIVYENKHGKGK